MIPTLIWTVAGLVIWFGLLWLLLNHRASNRKARVRRRLLVKEGDQVVCRVTRGRVLVGWPSSDGQTAASRM
jgi:hypothetical protein